MSSIVGCGEQNILKLEALADVNENIIECSVTHYYGGGTEEYSLDEEQILELHNWILEVEMANISFNDEEQPGNYNGGECYSFTSDAFTSFSLYDMGDDDNYIKVGQDWYKVLE